VFPNFTSAAISSSGAANQGAWMALSDSLASSGRYRRMNLPFASNFSLWLVGLKILKYGCASQPLLAAHCQPPLLADRSKSLSFSAK